MDADKIKIHGIKIRVKTLSKLAEIEVGEQTSLEYVTVLRSVLRQDPDVIMIGEIRDKESAELALQSALTGHLVISTLHASSSAEAKKRLIAMGIPKYLIESTLICACSQRLVLKICELCKVVDADPSFTDDYLIYKGVGCKECAHTGNRGRTVVSEFLHESSSLYQEALKKVRDGVISLSEAMKVRYDHVFL